MASSSSSVMLLLFKSPRRNVSREPGSDCRRLRAKIIYLLWSVLTATARCVRSSHLRLAVAQSIRRNWMFTVIDLLARTTAAVLCSGVGHKINLVEKKTNKFGADDPK